MRTLSFILFIVAAILPMALFLGSNPDSFSHVTRAELDIAPGYVTYHVCWLIACVTTFLICGGMIRRKFTRGYNDSVIFGFCIAAFALAVIGYACYFSLTKDIILSGGGSEAVLQKKGISLTSTGQPIVLIHLHLAFAILAAHLLINAPEFRGYRRNLLWVLVVAFFGLELIRAFGVGERLVVSEYGVPFAVFFVLRKSFRTKLALTTLGVCGFILFFVATESVRSWAILKDSVASEDSVWTFGIKRFAAYYTSSLNNASSSYSYDFGAQTGGYYLTRIISNSPVIGSLIPPLSNLRDDKADFWSYIFDQDKKINPEFNLFSAPGFSYLDFGWGGIFVGVIYGLFGAYCCNRGGLLPTLLFPIWCVSVMEISRILYLSQERLLPTYLFLMACAIFAGAKRGQDGALEPGTNYFIGAQPPHSSAIDVADPVEVSGGKI